MILAIQPSEPALLPTRLSTLHTLQCSISKCFFSMKNTRPPAQLAFIHRRTDATSYRGRGIVEELIQLRCVSQVLMIGDKLPTDMPFVNDDGSQLQPLSALQVSKMGRRLGSVAETAGQMRRTKASGFPCIQASQRKPSLAAFLFSLALPLTYSRRKSSFSSHRRIEHTTLRLLWPLIIC